MLTPAELQALDDAALTRDGFRLLDARDLIRRLVADARGQTYTFRLLEHDAVLVADPGQPPAVLFQREGATGLAELHAVASASPARVALPGTRAGVDKRLRRAIALIEPPAPMLARLLAEGLEVGTAGARWAPPWRMGRTHLACTT